MNLINSPTLEKEIEDSGNIIINITKLIRDKETFRKLVKFSIVGGTGAIITWGGTYILTEMFDLWYMASVIIATSLAILWNFTWNLKWTFAKYPTPTDADYEWYSFYHGNLIQKWWKRSIAKTVWDWIPNTKMLDVGCGSSPIISRYTNAIGLDLNMDKLTFMKNKLQNKEFIMGSVTGSWAKGLPDGSFDSIICIEVLEHCEEPNKMIYEMARLIKRDGSVVLATPDYSKSLWNIAELFTAYKDEHISKFTRNSLERMCLIYGLEPVQYKYIAGCDLVEEFRKIR